jgi:Ca-activated chloride channel family protein
MKYILVSLFVVAFVTDPFRIGKINRAKSEAREAYTSGDYKTAVQKYHYLIDSMKVMEDELKLNLANAYFMMNDTANALTNYESLAGSKVNAVRSKAQQQLGIMNYRKQKNEQALNNFKQAIKADPDNMDARYNYELLKKKLDEKKKKEEEEQKKDQQKKDQQKDQQQNKDQQQKDQQQKDQQQKEQEKKDQQNKDQKSKEQQQKEQQQKEQQQKEQQQKEQQQKEQEKKDQQQKEQQNPEQKQDQEKKKPNPELSEKLEQMKISEQKARMILEAMKNQEIQYLQQNKRKASKPKDKGKPDW